MLPATETCKIGLPQFCDAAASVCLEAKGYERCFVKAVSKL